ncbi:endolytic transglycosylase MltG [Candidatus Peregrinibacteria bacterium]|nr:MAG: endolytic transglycosylase MltG [Candidatus Peregrinibacteria bacterium]
MFSQKHIQRQKMSLRIKTMIAIIFVMGALFIAQEVQYRMLIAKSPESSDAVFPFTVEKGESLPNMSIRLQEEGLISSSWAFLRYAKRSGVAENIQAGTFYLPKNLPIPALTELLTKAVSQEISFTIPEGFTNADIDARLAEFSLAPKGAFLECVRTCDFSDFPFLPADPKLREGFFFPDTYFVNPENFSAEAFARRLLRTFDERTKTIFGTSSRNGWEILKMASILEKESRGDEERPIISGILWKRLDNDWLLGADATTRYATGKKTEALTIDDLQSKNPWNTRAVKGLPPGAICNPGLSSILAAANPEESSYWYYLHDMKGNIYYATTMEEHAENKEQYL